MGAPLPVANPPGVRGVVLRVTASVRAVPEAWRDLLILGFVALAALRLQAGVPFIDDAFIFMRFARNIVRGLGCVWNPGEPPIEGFTSPLYLLLLTMTEAAGLSQVVVVPWLGIGLSAAAIAVTWRLLQWLDPGHHEINLIGLGLVVLSPGVLFWATAGMETPLYMLLLVMAVLAYLRYRRGQLVAWWVGIWYGIAALARPEAIALAGITVTFDLVHRARGTRGVDSLHVLVAFLALCGSYFLACWWYFGDLLPNPYYAKTGGGWQQIVGGVSYGGKAASYLFALTAKVLIPLLILGLWRPADRWASAYVAAIVVASWGIAMALGGDHFGHARFVVPTVPLLLALVSRGMSTLVATVPRMSRPASVTAVSAICLLAVGGWAPATHVYPGVLKGLSALYYGPPPQRPADPRIVEIFEDWMTGFIRIGQTLKRIAGPGQSVALVPIGAVGYYSDMTVIDMVGLVDRVIAREPFDSAHTAIWRPGHNKGDGAYVLQRQPDYILFVDVLTSQPVPGLTLAAAEYKSIAELWTSPEFHRLYEFSPVRLDGGWYVNFYHRRTPDAVSRRSGLARRLRLAAAPARR